MAKKRKKVRTGTIAEGAMKGFALPFEIGASLLKPFRKPTEKMKPTKKVQDAGHRTRAEFSPDNPITLSISEKAGVKETPPNIERAFPRGKPRKKKKKSKKGK